MKITEITGKAYLRVEQLSGGLRITPLHLYPDCAHLVRPSERPRRLIEIDPDRLAEYLFVSPLLEGLRVCMNCRRKFEKPLTIEGEVKG
jgi:hypothetical protein